MNSYTCDGIILSSFVETTGLTKETKALYIAIGSAAVVMFAGLYVGCVILRRAKKTEGSSKFSTFLSKKCDVHLHQSMLRFSWYNMLL